MKLPASKPEANFAADRLELKTRGEPTADAIGYGFAIAALATFVLAGFIVYHAGNPEFRTASNDVRAVSLVAKESPAEFVPTHPR